MWGNRVRSRSAAAMVRFLRRSTEVVIPQQGHPYLLRLLQKHSSSHQSCERLDEATWTALVAGDIHSAADKRESHRIPIFVSTVAHKVQDILRVLHELRTVIIALTSAHSHKTKRLANDNT